MERQEAIQEIRSRWQEFYPASKDGKGIICPLCGHGKGGDGIRENPRAAKPHGLKCFGSCGFSGDILDLIQQDQGTDFNGAFQYAADQLNLHIDQPGRSAAPVPAPREEKKAAEPIQPVQDWTEYYKRCRERITDPAAVTYLQARGISPATAAAFDVGYDPAADPAHSGHRTPRIIIPVTAAHYIGRSVDPTTPKAFAKMNNKGAEIGIFNAAALNADRDSVFVVEGAFDALSVAEAGAAAIALNSTSNAEKLLKQLERESTGATLILCLDNDDAGRKATQILKDGLQRLDIPYLEANIAGTCKDPNEYLTADRAGFIAAVQRAQAQTTARPDNVKDYIERLMTGEIESFKEAGNRKTGFPNLDEQAGGLFSGLYVIAAISSLGKTSFALQLADQLAAAGTDVIFFSLEQSRLELVSKSLARITAQNDISTAVSSLSIRRGYLPEQVLQAADDYAERIGERLSIVEGNFDCDVSYIGDYTRKYIKRTGCRPVLVLDYLQILQGDPDKRQTAKEQVDFTVTELKRLSRELNITIFAISSINRSNYLTPVDFESLKESGGIEYTCDCLYGLQLQCLNEDLFSDPKALLKDKRARVKEEKAADPRRIELVCLKNRYGISSFSCYFDYFPAHDLFVPGKCEPGSEPYRPQKRAGRKL